jgi:hypothetical protein
MIRMIRKTGAPSLILLLLCLAAPLGAATDRKLGSFPAAELKAAAPGADVIFVVSGDNRPTTKGAPLPRVTRTILSEIGLIRPDFALWTGDTVYGYCDTREELEQEYQTFAAAALPLAGAVPLYNSPGNHEIHRPQTCSAPADQVCGAPCSEEVFRGHFGQLYGSFDYAGAHFIALDTDVPEAPDAITGEQLEWLKRDLEANKDARAIFLFTHTEFYSAPKIDPDQRHAAIANRCELQDLFRRYPVKAVFSGHEHIYSHEPAELHDGIDYFVAGGAGAPLYASPDRGGFSHYIVVRLSAAKPGDKPGDKLSYEVIEPGRLYTEDVEKPPTGTAQFWIVNSNDVVQPLPLRGVEVEVPASLGSCASLTAAATTLRRDKVVEIPGVMIDACKPASRGKLRLHVTGPDVPQGSVLVTVRRKP